MACSKCKKKQEREEILREMEKTEGIVKYVFLGVIILSIYGLYSLVSTFL